MKNLKRYFENNKNQHSYREWLKRKQGVDIESPEVRKFWDFVDLADWKSDGDYKRIERFIRDTYSDQEIRSIKRLYDKYLDDLNTKFEDDWLERNGGIGIGVSDDSWWDLRADVIGRGKELYNNITAEQLKEMGESHDYKENFGYGIPDLGREN